MRQTLTLIVLAFFIGCAATSQAQERIVSKSDADEIFALDKAGWETRVRKYVHPQGWTIRLKPLPTGTGLMSFDRATGMGLSIQPLFEEGTNGSPIALIVTSSFMLGSPITPRSDSAEGIEHEAKADLGRAYNVKVRIFDSSTFRHVELFITREAQ